MRVLLVAKIPLSERLKAGDVERLLASGALDQDRLTDAAACHRHALATVRAALESDQVLERSVDTLRRGDDHGCDLVVTVGGDGTVFTANALGGEVPLLTVNSDPAHSIGHFTRTTAAKVAGVLARVREGRAQREELPLLTATVGAERFRILNDCLFSSSNPAAMSKYLLEVDGRREPQRSSGVWIATASGSTAAIHSAGATPVEPHQAALLFRVREPFQGRLMSTILQGTQLPPRGLRLTPSAPGLSLYIDGPNFSYELPAGASVEFRAAERPLTLVG